MEFTPDTYLINKLDEVSERCWGLAQEYARLRGAYKSIEALEQFINATGQPTDTALQFINETNSSRVSRIISITISLSNNINKTMFAGSLSDSSSRKFQLIENLEDEILSVDELGLKHIALIFTESVQKYKNIHATSLRRIAENFSSDERNKIEIREHRSKIKMDKIIEQISLHCLDEMGWKNIKKLETKLATHATMDSDSNAKDSWLTGIPGYTFEDFLKYGDRAAQIASDFYHTWRFNIKPKEITKISKKNEVQYIRFWKSFCKNKHLFYEIDINSKLSEIGKIN